MATATARTNEINGNPFGNPEAFVSIPGAAGLIHISEASVRRYLTQKKLRRFKVGGRTLVKISDVLGLVREKK